MPHRDPVTGEFVAASEMDFDDIEIASFQESLAVLAADIDGNANQDHPTPDNPTFSGVELIDYDEIVDRNEELHLLRAQHLMHVYVNATGANDGTARAAVEVSTSPSRQVAFGQDTFDPIGDSDVQRCLEAPGTEDSIDIVGRPLFGVAHAPFNEVGSGVSGGGSSGEDEYTLDGFPQPVGRFHPRDELFVNGALEASNVDDQALHIELVGQHVYGVVHSE